MKVLNLRCSHDHRFEGWFGSNDEFDTQMREGLIECPFCGERTIERLPSAPHLNTLALREPSRKPSDPGEELRQMWLKAVRQVIDNTEDVGERFPEEARRIHYGEAEERGIRGQASAEEAEALREEGIEFFVMPVPSAMKGPLQ